MTHLSNRRFTLAGLICALFMLLAVFMLACPSGMAQQGNSVSKKMITVHNPVPAPLPTGKEQAFLPPILANLIKKPNLSPGWCKVDQTGPSPSLTLEFPAKSVHSTMYLTGPDRYVVDIKGAILTKAESSGVTLPVIWPFWDKVRYSQSDKETVRVVVDLKRPMNMELTRSSSGKSNVDKLIISPGPALTGVVSGPDDGSLCESRGAQGVFILTTSAGRMPSISMVGKNPVITLPDTWSAITKDFLSTTPVTALGIQGSGMGIKMVLETQYPVGWDLKQLYENVWAVYLFSLVEGVEVGNAGNDPAVTLRSSGNISVSEISVEEIPGTDSGRSLRLTVTRPPVQGLIGTGTDSTGLIRSVTVDNNMRGGVGLTVSLASSAVYLVEKAEDGLGVRIRFPRGALFGKTIILDPGHGGNDPGAIGPTGIREKDAVLDIGLRLKEILGNLQANVLMTRDTDIYITLGGRSSFGKDMLPDLFLSLHANSFTTTKPGGIETFYSKTSNPDSERLAKALQSSAVKTLGLVDRGVKVDDKLAVTKNRVIPAVLHEFCFVSNPSEEALLADPDCRQKMAQAMADGIVEFLKGGNTR